MNTAASPLSGAWQIQERLSAGVDDRESDDDAKFLWFLDEVIVTGDEWAAWEMPYVVRGGPTTGEIDITRRDRNEQWLQRGIFEVTSPQLRLCLAGAATDDRPEAFASTEENGHVLYVATKSEEPLPERGVA
jgi:hypothetical protein